MECERATKREMERGVVRKLLRWRPNLFLNELKFVGLFTFLTGLDFDLVKNSTSGMIGDCGKVGVYGFGEG